METDTALAFCMSIPFDLSGNAAGTAMVFSRWLPMTEEHFITIQEGGMKITFRFDLAGTLLVNNAADRVVLDRVSNVMANRIMADLIVTDLSQQLVEYTLTAACRVSAGQQPPDDTSNLAQECRSLACRVLSFSLTHFNRLVSYVYSVNGQFWLDEYPLDLENVASYFKRFGVKVKRPDEESEWQRCYVPGLGGVWRATNTDSSRYITEEGWSRIRDLMATTRKPPLVRQLLARADWLAESGHRRGAVSEAVSALEVAVHAFGRSPNAEKAFGPILAGRLRLSSLSEQVKHCGLSASVKYLLPTILSEEKLPTDVLQGCQEAVEERQNVMHNGQRDVNPDRTVRYLASIRKLCQILETYSDPVPE